MSGGDADEAAGTIEQEYRLDEPPGKVWRALSIPEVRDAWLPGEALADADPCSLVPGREVSYRMREDTAPFLESTVTFRISSDGAGGTRLRIVHELTDARLRPAHRAANGNGPLVLAA